MKTVLLALSILIAAPASAQNFWIPAEEFEEHSKEALEGSPVVDDVTGKQVYLLRDGQQVRIKIGVDNVLAQYVNGRSNLQVCSLVANYDTGVTNTVLSKHPDPSYTKQHTLRSDDYRTLCSDQGQLDENNILSAGLKVISPSQGLVKIRGISVRGTKGTQAPGDALANYEYSRALGYLWGDGSVTSDGKSLYFPKKNTSTSEHFGSVARAYFRSRLTENSQGTRYLVNLDGTTPSRFLERGLSLSDIPDKHAFFTSVVETEGAVLVARITDDPSRNRCTFIRNLVNDINPKCNANTCTSSNCATPNCAFIAHGKYRGRPDNPGVNTHCGVYLSGDDSDWRSLFRTNDFHFVKTDRTPGGEPRQYSPTSRPNYTR